MIVERVLISFVVMVSFFPLRLLMKLFIRMMIKGGQSLSPGDSDSINSGR
jgi:hypothetical protein